MTGRTENLYEGTVLLEFNEAKHAYTWENKLVPGVTTILKRLNKPALMPWAAKQTSEFVKKNAKDGMTKREIVTLADEAKGAYRRFTDEAADIGSIVHAYAEAKLKGEDAGLPWEKDDNQAVMKACGAFDEWFKAHDVKCLASEMMIFSKSMFYAGTCDFYGYIDGELVVADLKTSSGIWNDYLLQVAAYQLAIEEEANVKISARWIIRLDKKTGKFEAKRYPHNEGHCQAWRSLRELHKHLTRIEEENGL